MDQWLAVGMRTGDGVSLTAAVHETSEAPKVDLEKLRKKRFIDAETSRQMLSLGWRQYDLGDAGIDNIDTVIAGARIKF